MSASTVAYIGLGSNLEHPSQQIHSARADIAALAQVEEIVFSSLYCSPPMDNTDQPDYINAVMAVTTSLSPLALLQALQTIENQHGRVRQQRWGARTLDLDLLLYGTEVINLPDLIIPHSGLAERAFVLYPLYEIAPQLIIPVQGQLVDLVARCPLAGLKRLDA
jgi:2-amino-4-hydroxy-6-hydroxymethyldihydropteridine diphosphokinase